MGESSHLSSSLATAEVSNFDVSEFEQFFELGTGMEEVQNLINLKTQLTLFPDMSGISLVFSNLQGNLGDLPIRGKGSLSGIMGSELTYFYIVVCFPYICPNPTFTPSF